MSLAETKKPSVAPKPKFPLQNVASAKTQVAPPLVMKLQPPSKHNLISNSLSQCPNKPPVAPKPKVGRKPPVAEVKPTLQWSNQRCQQHRQQEQTRVRCETCSNHESVCLSGRCLCGEMRRIVLRCTGPAGHGCCLCSPDQYKHGKISAAPHSCNHAPCTTPIDKPLSKVGIATNQAPAGCGCTLVCGRDRTERQQTTETSCKSQSHLHQHKDAGVGTPIIKPPKFCRDKNLNTTAGVLLCAPAFAHVTKDASCQVSEDLSEEHRLAPERFQFSCLGSKARKVKREGPWTKLDNGHRKDGDAINSLKLPQAKGSISSLQRKFMVTQTEGNGGLSHKFAEVKTESKRSFQTPVKSSRRDELTLPHPIRYCSDNELEKKFDALSCDDRHQVKKTSEGHQSPKHTSKVVSLVKSAATTPEQVKSVVGQSSGLCRPTTSPPPPPILHHELNTNCSRMAALHSCQQGQSSVSSEKEQLDFISNPCGLDRIPPPFQPVGITTRPITKPFGSSNQVQGLGEKPCKEGLRKKSSFRNFLPLRLPIRKRSDRKTNVNTADVATSGSRPRRSRSADRAFSLSWHGSDADRRATVRVGGRAVSRGESFGGRDVCRRDVPASTSKSHSLSFPISPPDFDDDQPVYVNLGLAGCSLPERVYDEPECIFPGTLDADGYVDMRSLTALDLLARRRLMTEDGGMNSSEEDDDDDDDDDGDDDDVEEREGEDTGRFGDPEHGHGKQDEVTNSKKLHCIAHEIMTSEKVFVDVLKLLHVDFRDAVDKANQTLGRPIIDERTLNQILFYLPQLYKLNQDLLRDLEERLSCWGDEPKISDVILRKGPYLKMYSAYIREFDRNLALLDDSCRRSPSFAAAVREFEASPRCANLALRHYLLKPVQRIPQYQLLLTDYLKHLSQESEDFEGTRAALSVVREVAEHANECMKQGDNFQKLMQIQYSLAGHPEIVQPGRVFLKEGILMKLSRKIMQPRRFFLMNDTLLYTTPQQGGTYKLNNMLSLAGMKVSKPTQEAYQNELNIVSVQRSFILSASSAAEREEWLTAISHTIEEYTRKRITFTPREFTEEGIDRLETELGNKAPIWIPDSRVSMCMICTCDFTLTWRRHHCRACGKIICQECSQHRFPLKYLHDKPERVCDLCFDALHSEDVVPLDEHPAASNSKSPSINFSSVLQNMASSPNRKPKKIPSALKQVAASTEASSMSGYLQRAKGSRKPWKRLWFVVKDKVLYTYAASEDVAAMESLPLLGFTLDAAANDKDNPGTDFQLLHKTTLFYTFRAEDASIAQRWIKTIKAATVLDPGVSPLPC
uniref:FYVE, RhoGEF and PH domain-containing protein 6 isoform X2 n=1 Tax=Myxine glutinosa TaxID=7769 RepID=UPI00358F04C2